MTFMPRMTCGGIEIVSNVETKFLLPTFDVTVLLSTNTVGCGVFPILANVIVYVVLYARGTDGVNVITVFPGFQDMTPGSAGTMVNEERTSAVSIGFRKLNVNTVSRGMVFAPLFGSISTILPTALMVKFTVSCAYPGVS